MTKITPEHHKRIVQLDHMIEDLTGYRDVMKRNYARERHELNARLQELKRERDSLAQSIGE